MCALCQKTDQTNEKSVRRDWHHMTRVSGEKQKRKTQINVERQSSRRNKKNCIRQKERQSRGLVWTYVSYAKRQTNEKDTYIKRKYQEKSKKESPEECGKTQYKKKQE